MRLKWIMVDRKYAHGSNLASMLKMDFEGLSCSSSERARYMCYTLCTKTSLSFELSNFLSSLLGSSFCLEFCTYTKVLGNHEACISASRVWRLFGLLFLHLCYERLNE